MAKDREPATLFDGAASQHALSDHHRRIDDGIVILAGVMLTAVILAGPRPVTAAELAARRRTPPARVSTPAPRRAGVGRPGPACVRVPRNLALMGHAGAGMSGSSPLSPPRPATPAGPDSIPARVVPMPRRGPTRSHEAGGHVQAS